MRADKQIAKLAARVTADMSKDPNAMAIFKHLKRVYAGRLAFTPGLSMVFCAMMGNLRGGTMALTERNYNVTALITVPQEIKVGGVWFSYREIIDTVEPILDLLGDHATMHVT